MDQTELLTETIRQAQVNTRKVAVTGAGSKRRLLPEARAEMVSTVEHQGIVNYEPSELVVTARAGTPLRELNLALNQANQELAAEPPMFNGAATVGGAVSAGLSGPARPWRGSLRDAVLGVQLINGSAELLNFGGQVMKNVAGYDVSRLVTGAFGALGLVTSVSLRVHPKADQEATLAFTMDAQQAIEHCCSMKRLPLPVTGSVWLDGRLYLRFSGTESGIRDAVKRLGGERLNESSIWNDVRDQRLDFFQRSSPRLSRSTDARLWRVVTPVAAALPDDVEPGSVCIEWGGGLRWIWADSNTAVQMSDYAASVGGWAWCVGDAQPLNPLQQRVMQQTRRAFDPHGVFVSGFDFTEREPGQNVAETNEEPG